MIQILVLEDNIYKMQKIVDNEYLKWVNKAVCITAHQSEAERQIEMNHGYCLEALYLDRELQPGCGDGLNFLRTLDRSQVRKVYAVTMNPEARKEMQALCREKGIEFECLHL